MASGTMRPLITVQSDTSLQALRVNDGMFLWQPAVLGHSWLLPTLSAQWNSGDGSGL